MAVDPEVVETLSLEIKNVRCTGGRVVRVNAIYAADSGSNPNRRSFAACHTPLSLPCFLSFY